jgi:hypothetical protein
MSIGTQAIRKNGSKLKVSSGWFVADASFQRALIILSDGAFKLFAYVSLGADRGTGRYEATQKDLAQVLGRSRRIIGKYFAELEQKGICNISSGRNQYSRNIFEIRDDYWPYHRPQSIEQADRKEEDAYVAAARDSFLETGCTRGKFGVGDAKIARILRARGVSLEQLQDVLILGACRKFVSWLNGGPPEPVASLAYFEPLISEIQTQPFPPGYRECLQLKVKQLAKTWSESVKSRQEVSEEGIP